MMIYLDVDLLKLILMDLRKGVWKGIDHPIFPCMLIMLFLHRFFPIYHDISNPCRYINIWLPKSSYIGSLPLNFL